MKKIVFALILFFLAFSVCAQRKKDPRLFRKNTIFIEILGNGATFTLNYDRLFLQKDGFKIAGRIGYSILPGILDIKSVPLEMSLLISDQGNHHFEIGTGLSYIKGLKTENVITDYSGSGKYVSESLYLPFRIGYRYQRQRGRLFLKAGIIPMISIHEFENKFKRDSYFWLGGAAGYSF